MFVININCLLTNLLKKYLHLPSLNVRNGDKVDDPNESQYLIGLLAFLFDFGDKNIDSLLHNSLKFRAPEPLHCFAITSDELSSQTVLLPCASESHGRWKFSDHMSAIHALSLSTVCGSLIKLLDGIDNKLQPNLVAKHKHYYNQIIQYYNFILPCNLPSYLEPGEHTLATFALNCNKEIFAVSRFLLHKVIERTSTKKRTEMSKVWGKFYNYNLTILSSSTSGRKDSIGSSSHPPVSPSNDTKNSIEFHSVNDIDDKRNMACKQKTSLDVDKMSQIRKKSIHYSPTFISVSRKKKIQPR
eukprot:TRINITY_DN414_c0_g1_i1.p1 TRINITY_DN414_c0_g1~~TRINITY_DN414_c0_g1_i1.p1  ORF type:complete len:300 (-),score=16.33 TRINITY_DN414_c0_g1_i1:184-1083(-)